MSEHPDVNEQQQPSEVRRSKESPHLVNPFKEPRSPLMSAHQDTTAGDHIKEQRSLLTSTHRDLYIWRPRQSSTQLPDDSASGLLHTGDPIRSSLSTMDRSPMKHPQGQPSTSRFPSSDPTEVQVRTGKQFPDVSAAALDNFSTQAAVPSQPQHQLQRMNRTPSTPVSRQQHGAERRTQ